MKEDILNRRMQKITPSESRDEKSSPDGEKAVRPASGGPAANRPELQLKGLKKY
jgi:hypothetical protein